MPSYDIRSEALPDETGGLSAANLPKAADIRVRANQVKQQLRALDLIRFTPAERARLGPSMTLQEMRLCGLYARMTQAVPELMDEVRRPRTQMTDLYTLDLGLSQVAAAVNLNRQGARAGCIVLAADLTEALDRTEAAAQRRLQPGEPGITEGEQCQLLSRITILAEPQDSASQLQQGRKQRQQRDTQRRQQAVRQAAQARAQLARRDALGRLQPGQQDAALPNAEEDTGKPAGRRRLPAKAVPARSHGGGARPGGGGGGHDSGGGPSIG